MTNVYIIDTSKYTKEINYLDFPKNIKMHLDEKHSSSKQNSIIAWYELLSLSKLDFNQELSDIEFNEFGKPISNKLFFNISHSNNIVLIAISHDLVGVDVELVRKINKKERFCDFLHLDKTTTNEELIKEWTKYEAKVKCLGTSIFTSSNNNDICVHSKLITDSLGNNYYISICTNDEINIK